MDDDSHSLVDMRPNGFGWHVFNSVAESVTLVREMNVPYAPVTTQGVVPLAKNSCLQSTADANYYLGKQLTSKHISDSLDRTM
ncbi:hypothetical protein H257_08267 [Aphanomyces astaci]|uniref:Uncharacterized protein n=1 Tax=Aphanomyces astaci TaxID=112090 RepID=W4GG94_APHAT|nr:hypothetical protein H257_08267 [Aphanomyces astaci]ETV78054.1 hypothetical protein H257_08267 [Aphanomyces astaci]|eukprot:XP_009832391.1 hypothetical protein H257_08267 [Aphanomyces astaci]